jgi:hypothetical protein
MSTTIPESNTRRGLRAVPAYVWILAVVGAVLGAVMAGSGDFWSDTVPSVVTFLLAGLLLGLVVWGLATFARRG